MNWAKRTLQCLLVLSALDAFSSAQQTLSTAVPHLVSYSGHATDAQAKPISGIAGLTLAIYKDQNGGPALWLESQNIYVDAKGNYTVQLGATKPDGIPLDLFASGQARWLGVTVNGGTEQPRVLLLSVPYALKAADAETLGGLPASAFALAAPIGVSARSSSISQPASPNLSSPPPASGVTTNGGTINALPLWSTSTDIETSVITQTGSGATAKIGIGTTTPATPLDVKGAETVRGTLSLPATATATAAAGKNSAAQNFIASVFNSSVGTAVPQKFQWQAEPLNNNTATASGTVNLLYASGSAAPTETGLMINNKGVVTFAPGQTFPGTGPGTVKSVGLSAPTSDFTVSGSPVTGTGILNLAWNVAPSSASTANSIVKRDASGAFAAGGITSISSSIGVTGQSTGTSNTADGVAGVTSSAFGAGVAGINNSGVQNSFGVYGTGSIGIYGIGDDFSSVATGVWGQIDNGAVYGAGVYGLLGTPSINGAAGFPAALWADTGTPGGYALLATADDGQAGIFSANSPAFPALWAINGGGIQFRAGGGAGACDVDATGNLNCTGAKHAIVPLDGGKRKVAMAAIESPQNWFEDFGSAQLHNGVAVVRLDSDFMQTVNTEKDYKVFPVANGDCKGLYVTNKTATSFEVRELGGGTSNISFDYRITAVRRNYEAIRFEDHTSEFDPKKLSALTHTGRVQLPRIKNERF